MNPDHLRMNPAAVIFVRQFVATGKTVAAICHGPWTLVEAGALKRKTVTSWPSLKTDIKNAGGNWVDQAVVADGQFIFRRKPDDIPAFNKAIIRSARCTGACARIVHHKPNWSSILSQPLREGMEAVLFLQAIASSARIHPLIPDSFCPAARNHQPRRLPYTEGKSPQMASARSPRASL